jgi:copper chaperone CopZ
MIYKIKGMECPSCATLLELDLEEAGIKCKCSYPKGEIEITGAYNKNKVIEIVSKSGYSIKNSD